MRRFEPHRPLGAILLALLVLAPAGSSLHAAGEDGELELRAMDLGDSNRDGVFQPGEAVTLRLVIFNPTGQTLRRPVRLSGPGLILDDERWIEVPPRSAVELERPLAGLLDPTLEARSETRIRIGLGNRHRELPVWVSHPLELDGEITVSGTSETGMPSRIAVVIHNTSDKDLPAVVRATIAGGHPAEARLSLPRVPAGSTAEASFELTDLDPDAHRSREVTFEVAANGRTHDRLAYGLAASLASRSAVEAAAESAGAGRPPATP